MTDPQLPHPAGAPDDLASAEGAALSEAIEEVDEPEPLPSETDPGRANSLAREAAEAAGGEEVGAEAEVEAQVAESAPAVGPARATADRAGRRTSRTHERPTPAAANVEPETLPYIDDPVSRWWVILIAVVFAAIFAWGIFLGHGGILTPLPTPSPIPSATVAPSPTPTVAPTPSASGTPSLSPTPSASATPTISPSPSAGGSPSPTSS